MRANSTKYSVRSWLDLELDLLRVAGEATAAIRNTPFDPSAFRTKAAYDGTPDGDVVMPADLAAQRKYEDLHRQWPLLGLIAEERNVRVPCSLPSHMSGWYAYLTADGLDGSKRYGRGLKDGLSTMSAFVCDGEVRIAVVRDVFTDDTYLLSVAYDNRVFLRNAKGQRSLSAIPRPAGLATMPLILRGRDKGYHSLVAQMLDQHGGEQLDYTDEHVSIGLSMAWLWTGDVGLHVQAPGFWTPWDDTPTIGIGRALGMVWFRPSEDDAALEEFVPPLVHKVTRRPHCVVIVHRSHLAELHQLVPLQLLG